MTNTGIANDHTSKSKIEIQSIFFYLFFFFWGGGGSNSLVISVVAIVCGLVLN